MTSPRGRAPKTPAPPAAATPARPPRRRRLFLVGASLCLAVLAGVWIWQWRADASFAARLPETPDLGAKTPALRPALEEARRAAGRRGRGLDALADLARLHHANGHLAEAETCWLLLVERQPDEARWRYYLADLARNRADEDGLRTRLEETVARDTTYTPAWLELGDIAQKRQNLDAAAHAYRQVLDRSPGDVHARFGLARLHAAAGRTREAETELEALLRSAPGFSSARGIYAGLLEARGDRQGAAEQRWQGMAAGRAREPEDPWLTELRPYCYDGYRLSVWASQEEQTRRPDLARALFERAIAVDPENPVAYAELGQLLLDLGERDQARTLLERGLARAPTHEKLQLRLSRALRDLGRHAEALANDERALARDPASAEFLNSLGQSLALLNRPAEAEQAFRRALQHTPNAVGPRVNLGVLLLQTGRRAEARASLEAALQDNPGYPKLLVTLGRLALEENRLDDAERVIRPYFQQYPGNTNARALFTQLHLDRATQAQAAGDLTLAAQWCAQGLAAVPDSAELHGLLGAIHLANRDLPRALASMEASRRLRPGDPRAVLPLATLYRQLERPADARRVLLEARAWLQANGGGHLVTQLDRMLQALPPDGPGR